jgi:hypothetical protein
MSNHRTDRSVVQRSHRQIVNRKKYVRRLRVESLENRLMMATDLMESPVLGFSPLPPQDALLDNNSNAGQRDSGAIPLSNTFRLHSNPKATKTLYMDFDGFTCEGTSWNSSYNIQSIVSPAYDPAGNGAAFTDDELIQVQEAWQRVAADFAPFDIDITTEDPGEANLVNTGGSDDRWGIRVVMTLVNFSNLNIGGFAYIGSFNWNYEKQGATDTPAYVFNNTSYYVAPAVTHEAGHSLFLSHDGTTAANPVQPSAEYYNGHGTGETAWGPIMGSGYYRNVTSWDDGTYLGSSNGSASANFNKGPSDLDVITQNNGFDFLPDDFGDTTSSATTLLGTSIPGGRQTISQVGSITRASDVDYFKFQTGTGPIDITIDPYINEVWTSDGKGGYVSTIESSFLNGNDWSQNQGSNLDVEATIYDSKGKVVAVANQPGLRASFANLNLDVGTYYLKVDGVGFGNPKVDPPTGYSDYGSLGQYRISGTIATSIDIDIQGTASFVENSAPVAVAPDAVFASFSTSSFDGGTLQIDIGTNYQVGDRLGFSPTGTDPGQISIDGNDISYSGSLIGSLSLGVRSGTITLNAQADALAIQALIRTLTFEHTTDGPSSAQRQVTLLLDNGTNGSSNVAVARVGVVPTNDSPSLGGANLAPVLEDTAEPQGSKISAIIGSSFRDVDLGSSLGGIAVTQNNATVATGVWQHSIDGAQWSPIGAVSSTASLLLSRNAWVRFKPGRDFDGTPAPLRIRGLDDTFSGAYTTAASRKSINTTLSVVDGPMSLSDSTLGTRMIPVNDPPVALVGAQAVQTLEDDPFSFSIPVSTWFSDVDNATLQIAVAQKNGQGTSTWLTVDPVSGALSGIPTNEDVGSFDLLIQAIDADGAIASVPLSLTVINVNDAPTNINLVGSSVSENASNVFVGTLFGTDPDATDTLNWSLTDARFEIRGNQLFIAAGQSIDYEKNRFVDLKVRATDSGTPQYFLDKVIRIDVLDVNEFAPALRPTTYRIQENSPSGNLVAGLTAPDGDTANRVKYRFVGAPLTQFVVDADTGSLSIAAGAAIDFETTQSYQLFVEAYDNGAPQLTTTASVNVVIEDVNEYSPILKTDSLSISEAQAANVVFATIQATDLDLRQKLVYSLLTTESRFKIEPATGAISLASAGLFDFETNNTSSLVVRVTDPGGLFAEKSIPIEVLDANDPPTNVKTALNAILSNVSGIDLGSVTVADQDVGQKYEVQSLDDRFVIKDGRLLLAPGQSMTELDPLVIVVPVKATEIGTNPISYSLSVNVTRIPNPNPWQNQANPLNVDRSGPGEGTPVDPRDALVVINAINSRLLGKLPFPRPASTLDQSDVDVDGDGFLNPLDVLVIVNYLNRNSRPGSGEGESTDSEKIAQPSPVFYSDLVKSEKTMDADVWLNAYRQLEEELQARRRRA